MLTVENKIDNRLRALSVLLSVIYSIMAFIFIVYINKQWYIRIYVAAMMFFTILMGLYGSFSKHKQTYPELKIDGKIPETPPTSSVYFEKYFTRGFSYKKDRVKLDTRALSAAILELEALGYLKIGYSEERGMLLNVTEFIPQYSTAKPSRTVEETATSVQTAKELFEELKSKKRKTKSVALKSVAPQVNSKALPRLPLRLEPIYELLKEIDALKNGPMCMKEFEFYVMYHSIRTEGFISSFTYSSKKDYTNSLNKKNTRNFGKSENSSRVFQAFFAIFFIGFFISSMFIGMLNPFNIILTFTFFFPLIVSNGITDNLTEKGLKYTVELIAFREYLANYDKYYDRLPIKESLISTYLSYSFALNVHKSFSAHLKTFHKGLNIALFSGNASDSVIKSAEVFI